MQVKEVGKAIGVKENYGQVSFNKSRGEGDLVNVTGADEQSRREDMLSMQCSLTDLSTDWPENSWRKASPFPILMKQHQVDRVVTLHTLLTKAITSIVERWWTDQESHYAQRMPLEPYEEDVLQVGRLARGHRIGMLIGCSGWIAKVGMLFVHSGRVREVGDLTS